MSGAFQIQLFTQSANAAVGWRMLSGNNREAGRGVDRFADESRCRSAVAMLQADTMSLYPRVRRSTSRLWTWEIQVDGRLIATAPHAFDRMIRCEQSAAQFLTNFARAGVGLALVHAGSRRR
ncbi:MAG TPA: hypothetical protein VGN18_12715 [Jatrophihabitans sp.]|jgi:hypothetical protein|uniref:hypothetical protein n=1 Tax=Jatrophihabitans sp. TaxID=1932789 RepID=UPI002DFD6D6C|nr:hypothetical protein [Jatrophihabitans sp.]